MAVKFEMDLLESMLPHFIPDNTNNPFLSIGHNHHHGLKRQTHPHISSSTNTSPPRNPDAKLLASQGKQGLVILPGVESLLSQIRLNPSAENHYAICTSASRIFATTALSTAGITPPTHLLTADDCTHGKPDPEPYLKGAALLGVDIKNCLVIEDAPAGIRSGVAAGAKVMAVCTSHSREQVEGLGASFVVERLSEVGVEWREGRMVVRVGV